MKLFILLSIFASHLTYAETASRCSDVNATEENLKISIGEFKRTNIVDEIQKQVSPGDLVKELGGSYLLLLDNTGCRRIVNSIQFFSKTSDGCEMIYTVLIWDQTLDQFKDTAEVRKRSLNCQSQNSSGIYTFKRP